MLTLLKVPTFIIFLIPAVITSVIVGIFYKEAAAYLKFITKGKDPIKAGIVMVTDLLEKGVHPDDIIIMGNSLGGGIAAEVLKKFEEEDIHFTFIYSNSYDSWKNVPKSQRSPLSTLFKRISIVVGIWFKLCHLNYKPNKIIKSAKSPVLVTNRIGNIVIDEAAQSVFNLQKSKDNFERDNGLKVTALLSSDSDNVHVEPLTKMMVNNIDYLCSRNASSLNKSKTYEELLENFIVEAYEYLKEEKLNKDFNFNTFKQNKFYQKMKKSKVSLIDIDNPKLQISPIISRKKII